MGALGHVTGQLEENCIAQPQNRVIIEDVILGQTSAANRAGYFRHSDGRLRRGEQAGRAAARSPSRGPLRSVGGGAAGGGGETCCRALIRDGREGTRELYRGGKALLRDGYGGINSLCGDFPPQMVAGFLLGLYVMTTCRPVHGIGGLLGGGGVVLWCASMMDDVHTRNNR